MKIRVKILLLNDLISKKKHLHGSLTATEAAADGASGVEIDLTESDDERLASAATFGDESNGDLIDTVSTNAQVLASQRAESPCSDAMSMSSPSSSDDTNEISDLLPPTADDMLPLTIPLPSPFIPLPPGPPPPVVASLGLSPMIPLPPGPPNPCVPPHNVGYPSFYPTTKIPISLLSGSTQSTAPSTVSADSGLHYSESAYNAAPYEAQGAQNGSMVDLMSMMSGISDYGAFTMAPNQFTPQPPPPSGGTGDNRNNSFCR